MYILRSFYFCGIWALCVAWVTSNQFCYAPCLTCRALFGSLVKLMYNRTLWCDRVHESPWGHWRIDNNREGTLSVFFTSYVHFTSVEFENSVCHESLPTSFVMYLAWLVQHSLVHWYQQYVTYIMMYPSASVTRGPLADW